MNANDYFENYAIKRTLFPIILYIVLTGLIFYIGHQIIEGAENYLNHDQLDLVDSLKITVYIMMSTIWLFIVIFNKNLLEVSAIQQFTGIFKTSPYPVMIIRLKDQAIITSSSNLARMLDYGNKEILSLALSDIMTEKSIKEITEKRNIEITVDQHLNELQFIDKNKNLVKNEVSLLPFELAGREYLIVRCKVNDDHQRSSQHPFHF
ncbi:MAG: hypothetical protein ACOVP1_04000 [Bacteroidia bacterium]